MKLTKSYIESKINNLGYKIDNKEFNVYYSWGRSPRAIKTNYIFRVKNTGKFYNSDGIEITTVEECIELRMPIKPPVKKKVHRGKSKNSTHVIKLRKLENCKSVKLFFPFEAKPKQSVRVARSKNGEIVKYKDPKIKAYEDKIKLLARPQLNGIKLTGGVMYTATYLFEVPNSYPIWIKEAVKEGHTVYKETKPDIDSNLNKAIIDAIAPLIMDDDSRIALLGQVEKSYGVKAGIEIELKELPAPDYRQKKARI